MDGVGGGEGVVDHVPVAMVVLGVEAGQSQGGGVGHGPGQLLGGGTEVDGPVKGGDDLAGIVAQHGPSQSIDVVGPAEGSRPRRRPHPVGQVPVDAGQEGGEVVRMAPGAAFLRT